ncbi:Ral GTPase-activating protein subunit beta [Elysia marginata]|uniref:Ral GTPase-activating protein subunit beta n=1 Tax=Elysia marginata TaxID=1093978 RepID=A0AAV4IUS1_9GAST|nr:Ral GTPase-activating protein subunit beta [Elysia marginata]
MLCAAFKCLQLWLVEHSSLLYDRECLHQVLEVVELGISGSKSQTKTQEVQTIKVKLDKDSKSVSMKHLRDKGMLILIIYSQTCLRRPLKINDDCGCHGQVVLLGSILM